MGTDSQSNQSFFIYVMIAFVIGGVMGLVGANALSDNDALVADAIDTALAAQEEQITGAFDDAMATQESQIDGLLDNALAVQEEQLSNLPDTEAAITRAVDAALVAFGEELAALPDTETVIADAVTAALAAQGEQFAALPDTETVIADAVAAALAAQEEQISGIFDSALAEALANAQPAQPAPPPTPDPNVRHEVDIEGDPFLGAEDAVITIVEFSDFRCGYCNRFRVETLPLILENYAGLVRYVYKDFPILGANSTGAALAAGCADDQGKFWDYHDGLFNNQALIGTDYFTQLAEELELDMDEFQTCLENQTHQGALAADFEAARSIGAQGTPAFLINGKFVSGAQPYANFAAIIDAELAALEANEG